MMIGNHRPNININVVDPTIRFAHFRFLDKIAIKIISAAAAIELCKLCLIYLFFFCSRAVIQCPTLKSLADKIFMWTADDFICDFNLAEH